MNRKSTRSRNGFTMAECLVSIAILAIAMVGTLAALAFDLTTSEQNGAYTFANSYNRKIMDLIQSGQLDPIASGVATSPAAPASLTATTGWKPLDDGLLASGGGAPDFWGRPGSVELQRWQTEKGRYQTNIVANRLLPNFSGQNVNNRFKNLMVEVVITTRWSNKKSWRGTQLRGFYTTAPQA